MEAHFLCLQQPGESRKQHRLKSETQLVLELLQSGVGQAQNIHLASEMCNSWWALSKAPLPACSHITLPPWTASKYLLATALSRCAGDLVQQEEMVCYQNGTRVGLYQRCSFRLTGWQ